MFTDNKQLRTYLGGGINASLEIENVRPYWDTAFSEYFKQWLGTAFIEELKTNFNTSALGGGTGNPGDYDDIYPYVQKALALFGIYKYSFIGNVQFSDAGIVRAESDGMKTAFKYQEVGYRDTLLADAYESLELLLIWLEDKGDQYPTWRDSPAYDLNRELFVHTAEMMQLYYSTQISRHTYNVIRPIIDDVECTFIRTALGPTLFDSLRSKWGTGATLNTYEKALFKMLRKAIAKATVQEGIRRNTIQLAGSNIIHSRNNEDYYKQEGRGTRLDYSLSWVYHDDWVRNDLVKICDYLHEQVAADPDRFPGFPYNSTAHGEDCDCHECAWKTITNHCWDTSDGEATYDSKSCDGSSACGCDECCHWREEKYCSCDSKFSCGCATKRRGIVSL